MLHGGPEFVGALLEVDEPGGAELLGLAGPGQLEEEIEAGEWFVSPALAQDVITPGPADLWSDVMKRQPMPLPLYSTYPVNVEDN